MKILITGGAGFIGSNCAHYFCPKGHDVLLFDNLSRVGSNRNLTWLRDAHPVRFVQGDVRDLNQLRRVLQVEAPFDLVLHLAAQVAVTTSVKDPLEDFRINTLGTLNLLESVRMHSPGSVLIYASTNKVYGRMEDLEIEEGDGRYRLKAGMEGIHEERNLDFHSPYGCSKGAADQYCRDYARIYGLKTLVMRMSCVYGPRQFGVEDHGWVAWFSIAAAAGKTITICGNGKQVRDILFVEDLVRLYEAAYEYAEGNTGRVFNVGGGMDNTLSLLELISLLKAISGKTVSLRFTGQRPGDQPLYISDISRVRRAFGWGPSVTPEAGVRALYEWVVANNAACQGEA